MRRLCLLAASLVLSVLAPLAAAQPAPRAVIAHDNAASAKASAMPRADALDNMEISTVEPGEPQHLCTSPVPTTGAGSIWYYVEVPDGTLVVDTAGSEFSTAVSVYPKPYGVLDVATLQAAGCSAIGPNASAQARLSKHLNAGAYLIQISRIVGLLGANDLLVDFDFDPDGATKGDRRSNPVKLTAGKIATVRNVENAFGTEPSEPAPTCNHTQPRTSVWFSYTVPFDGFLVASAEGTFTSTQADVLDGVTLTVFQPPAGVLCQTNAANTPLIFPVSAGQALEFRLTANRYTNLSAPSVYKFAIHHESAHFLANGTFESDLAGWKLKKAANGDGITTTGGEVIAGTKSFKFVGGPAEATSLSTTVNIPATLRLRNTRLVLFIGHRPLPAPQKLSWQIAIYPSDGSPPTVLKRSADVAALSTAVAQYLVETERVDKLKLTIKNKNPSGSLVIDDVDFWLVQTTPVRGPLGLPPAPGG